MQRKLVNATFDTKSIHPARILPFGQYVGAYVGIASLCWITCLNIPQYNGALFSNYRLCSTNIIARVCESMVIKVCKQFYCRQVNLTH